jgi:hypothetical protein
MPGATPIYGIPYPCGNENIDCDIFDDWALGIQDAIVSVRTLESQALNRPSARVSGTNMSGFVSGANANLVFQTEVYDSNNMVDLAVDNISFTIQTAGWYLCGTSAEVSIGGATTSTALGLAQNGAFTFRKKMSPNTVNANLTPGIQVIGLMRCAVGDVVRSVFTYTGGASPVVLNYTMFGYMTTRL